MDIWRGVDRKLWWRWGAVGLLGLMALALSGVLGGTSAPAPAKGTRSHAAATAGGIRARERSLAAELAGILGKVRGAGRVWVSVSLRSGPGERLAQSTADKEQTAQQGGQTTTSRDRTAAPVLRRTGSGGQTPVVIQERSPRVAGVLVVAQGAGDPTVRWALTEAVQAALDLPAYRIEVLPGEEAASHVG